MLYPYLLIGLHVEIVQSADKSLVGRLGVVVYETKNLLFLRTDAGRMIKVPKSIVSVKANEQGKSVLIDGKQILDAPQERIKG